MRVDDQVAGLYGQHYRPVTPNPKVQPNDGAAANEQPPGPAAETAPAPAASQQKAADTSAENSGDGAPKTAYEKIVEVGFSQFVADLEEEKLKKLREKILVAMGLNEEMLAEMTPEQCGAIEKLIAAEIQRRIEGGAVMNGAPNDDKIAPGQDTGSLKPLGGGGGGMATGKVVNDGTNTLGSVISSGLGPLLALQKIDDKDAQTAFTDGQEKVGKKDPYGV